MLLWADHLISPLMNESKTVTIGAVAIGRNEGVRLEACLKSLLRVVDTVVYVDSGSTDDSVAMAKSLGVTVVDLDTSIPFTAARARNAGYSELMGKISNKDSALVQFVDGDCEVAEGWIDAASAFLLNNKEVASVCGRRRERHPADSVFNRLCDIEWDTPVGEAKSTGGDFLVRSKAFDSVEGFNPGLIAGEEPDLCYRLRENEWKIWRLDQEMTRHDAAMTKLSQWWQRNKRAGYAYANGYFLHGAPPERFRMREVMRSAVFGAGLPLAVIVGLIFEGPAAFLLLLIYGMQVARTFMKRGDLGEGRFAYAMSCTFAKVPEAFGILKFRLDRLRGSQSGLIEYK